MHAVSPPATSRPSSTFPCSSPSLAPFPLKLSFSTPSLAVSHAICTPLQKDDPVLMITVGHWTFLPHSYFISGQKQAPPQQFATSDYLMISAGAPSEITINSARRGLVQNQGSYKMSSPLSKMSS